MEAWERQPGETTRAYAAFCVYRDMGPTRSLDKACELFRAAGGKPPLTDRPRWWEQWSSANRWVERAAAYDAQIDAAAAAALRARKIDKRLALVEQGLRDVETQLRLWYETVGIPIPDWLDAPASELSIERGPVDIDAMYKLARWRLTLEQQARMSLGLPTSFNSGEMTLSGPDGGAVEIDVKNMTDEELERIAGRRR